MIVMDEPTSALNAPEVERLFGLIAQLKAQGCGIVYITHKMEEIERIADRITVLRDGRLVGIGRRPLELPPPKLIHWMVGREVEQQFPRHAPHARRRSACGSRISPWSTARAARPLVDDVSLVGPRGRDPGDRRACRARATASC